VFHNRLAGAAIALLAMCAPITAAMAEPTTVTFASWQLEEPGNSDWWKAVIAAFEKQNPDIHIEQQYVPFKDFTNQMTIRFAANRAPDILQLSQQTMPAFAAQGWLASLDPWTKGTEYEKDWSDSQKTNIWDGKTQGLLVSNSAYMLFYNEKILSAAGVSVPKDFTEFVASVPKITKPEAGVFGLAAVTTEHPTAVEDFIRFVRWSGQDIVKDGKYDLTSPGVVAAIDTYRRVVGQNAPLGNNSAIARQLFLDGKTGFLIDGPWFWSWLDKAPPDLRPSLKMIKAPFAPALAPGGITLHIAAGIDDALKDKAWSFIAFAAQPEWQRQYLLATGQPPGRAHDVLTEDDHRKYPHLRLIAEQAMSSQAVFPAVQAIQANFNEFTAIIMRAALRALSTKDDTAAILADAQAELETAIPLD